jgi:hypothetical protein
VQSDKTVNALKGMAVLAALLTLWAGFDFAERRPSATEQFAVAGNSDSVGSIAYTKPSPFAIPGTKSRPVRRRAETGQTDFASPR